MSSLKYESQVRPPLVSGDKNYHQISEDILRPIENPPSRLWWTGFLIAVALLCFGIFSVTREVLYGTGMWNLNKTIGWAWDITNFVWWIGIGHAGTLISAILLLFRQQWRTGVNRAAEAMTIFAVMCAGQFPIWHMGRVWVAFFTLPYPNTRGALWPNFNSPLLWDVFAISTYFTVSLLFWYCGLLPDLATVRDRAKLKWRKFFYGTASVRRWCFPFTPLYHSTAPLRLCPDGTPPYSRHISLPVRYSRDLPWCNPC
jgi:molybdopterin-containing oxidoreductase family membrane subunit